MSVAKISEAKTSVAVAKMSVDKMLEARMSVAKKTVTQTSVAKKFSLEFLFRSILGAYRRHVKATQTRLV